MAMASPAKNNLKIKIIDKRSNTGATGSAKPFLTRDGQGVAAKRSKDTELKSICGTKRGAEGIIDDRGGKRFKMDRTVVRKCLLILNKLMTHPYSPGFSEPVDPVALNIPDYFTVISRPMDLGTIKFKLEKDLYATTSEFEADIRLTFSNAKKYNPPGNPFHKMAEELNSLFSAQWRFVVSVIERESMKGKADTELSDGGKKLLDASRRSNLVTEKVNVKGSKQEPALKVPAKKVRTAEEEKNQVTKMGSKLSAAAVSVGSKSSVTVENVCHKSMHSDALHRKSTVSTKTMVPMKRKEPSIGKKVPLSNARTSDLRAPSSDLKTSMKVVDQVAINCKPLKKCDPQPTSRGALSWLDEEPTFVNHATPASTAFDSDDWRSPVCETHLSPAKALRAEMLKRRFADTILKAQKLTLLCPGERCDQVKMEVEKQRLGRPHAEEKLKTEGEVKASLDGHRSDRRIQCQREREAARRALEKMEQSVEFEDNIAILRDLAYMIGDSSFAGPLRGYGGMYVAANQFVNGKLQSPLERLGLYLKEDDDYMFGDDQGHDRERTLPEDYEEGELIY